jgi:hypothetical protein
LDESRKSKAYTRKSLAISNTDFCTSNLESNAYSNTYPRNSYLNHLRKLSFVRRTTSFTAIHRVEAVKAFSRRSFTVHCFDFSSKYDSKSSDAIKTLKYRHLRYRHTNKILVKSINRVARSIFCFGFDFIELS